MTIGQIELLVKYVTNTAGEKTDVLIPFAVLEELMASLQSALPGCDWVDENEPKSQILADLQESIRQATAGQTFPVSELWDDIEV
jgi:hypothetical protein